MPAERVRARASPFVGRSAEMERIASAFAGDARLVSLLGPGGVGKTRLAERHAETYAARVVLCELAEVVTADEMTLVVLAALGDRDDDGSRRASANVDRVASSLARAGDTLVVLDNFEQLVGDGSRLVAQWIDAAPHARFLVTSRRALGIAMERRVVVGPLEEDACVALFTSAASRVGIEVDPSGGEHAIVRRIVDALDRLPLAVELAAARLLVLGPEEMLARLADRFAVLRSTRHDVEPRHATLAATVAWSCDLLTDPQRSALAQCTVFHGGFDLSAAEAVIRTADGSSALDLVHELLERSLLHVARVGPRGRRFDLLDTIRAYATTELRTSDSPIASAEMRHASHYATRFDGALEAPDDVLVTERANLVAAVHRTTRDRPVIAARAGLALEPFLRTRVSRDEHRRWIDETLAAASRTGDASLVARARSRRARARSIEGELADAEADLFDVRAARREGDESPAVRIERLRTEAMIRRLQRRVPEAIALSEAALDAVRAEPDHVASEGHVLRELAVVLMLAGRRSEAESRYRESLAAHRGTRDRQAEATLLCDLGVLRLDAGDVEEADRLLGDALVIHRARSDRWREAIALSNLAVLEHQRGRVAESRAQWELALSVHRELGNARFEAFSLGGLGAVEIEEGHVDRARAVLVRAVAIFAELGDARWGGWAVARLATAHAAAGDLARARETFADARALLAQTDPSWWRPMLETLERSLDVTAAADATQPSEATSAERIAHRLITALASRSRGRSTRATVSGVPAPVDRAHQPAVRGALHIGPDAAWFQAPHGPRVDMSRRRVGRRILLRLAERRIESPGTVLSTDELVAAAWPGERMRRDSASSRLYVAVRELRRLGLHDLLVTTRGGYVLLDSVPIELEREPTT